MSANVKTPPLPKALQTLKHKLPAIQARAQCYQVIRSWMQTNGFLELQTPIILPATLPERGITPVNACLHTHGNQARSAKLRPSPEISLKKLSAIAAVPCYELGPVFRDQEPFTAALHNPEFTLLEWYRPHAPLSQLLQDLQQLCAASAIALHNKTECWVKGKRIALSPNAWQILSMETAFKRYADIDIHPPSADDSWNFLIPIANQRGAQVTTAEIAFDWLIAAELEPKLPRTLALILTHYPAIAAAFSRLDPQDPRYALRAEAYIGGIELANAAEELCDANEQLKRMKNNPDPAFLAALPQLQQLSGIALGIDRLLMLLLGKTRIQDVLAFPAEELFPAPSLSTTAANTTQHQHVNP